MTTQEIERWEKSGYLVCRPGRPMPPKAIGKWVHVSAREIGDQKDGWPSGDIATMKCDDCGHTWEQELPQ